MNDILLGQYIYADSVVHRLDGRTKIIATIFLLVTIFFIRDLIGFALFLAVLLFITHYSKIPFRLVFRSVKSLRWIIILTFIINVFFIQKGDVLWSFWVIRITKGGVSQAVMVSLRLIFLVMTTSLLTFTTTPMELTDGIERLLLPLKRIHFPVHEIAMMMTIAMRFIPTLLDETQKIKKAQMARGADFESGNIFTRAKAMLPILIPLFVSSFRRADELAIAMESRCYHGDEGRTRMNQSHIGKQDVIAMVILVVACGLIIFWSKKYATNMFAS